jgi:hypothetical protein
MYRVILWSAGFGWLACSLPLPAQFIAFNDHAPGAGTHSNTTVWSCLISPNGGLLKEIATGLDTPVRLDITRTGVGAATGGSAASYPQIGTPAQVTFTNYVDFIGTPGAAVQISNVVVHYSFSGLDPAKRYNFKGSAVRGGSGGNYTNRWTKVAIAGADSSIPQHTANVIASDRQSTLAANEVVVNFGVNFAGDMVVWDQIDPGADGTFEITCDFYRGALPAPNSATLNFPPYGYAITALRLEEFSNVTQPISIVSGPNPSSTNIVQGDSTSFSVNVTGTSPHFRWFRVDGQPIAHAVGINSAILSFANAQPSDGLPTTYRVEVTNAISTNISGGAVLSVAQDTTPPALTGALAYLSGTNFLASFSERLDPSSVQSGAFHIHLVEGGGELPVVSLVLTNGTNLYITTLTARSSTGNYILTLDAGGVFDANGNAFAGGERPFLMEVALLSFDNTPWKYNAEAVDPGTGFAAVAYDDGAWSSGFSVFDVLRPQPPGRTNVAGFSVATQLPLTNAIYPVTTGVIPTYYYRTHFRLPTTLAHVHTLRLRTLIDDFDTFYLNGTEAYRNAGYPAAFSPGFGYSGGAAVGTASIAGPFTISLANLVEGDNVAAAIVNQANAGSSDSTFAYELVATVDHLDAPPSLTLSRDVSTGAITLTWPAGTGARLYESDTIDGLGWAVVNGALDGSYSFSPPGVASSQKFFSLRR